MLFTENIKQQLNQAQQEAVLHNNTALLVLSGAGTGKTRVISYKIAYLILEKEYQLNRILALTFTNKAAKEMKQRTLDVLRQFIKLESTDERYSYIGTFHANCIKILRWHGKILGYTAYFSIIDDDDQLSLIKRIIKDNHLVNLPKPTSIRNQLSKYKNDFISPKEMEDLAVQQNSPLLKDLAILYTEYQKILLEANSMDFDDIQLNVIYLFHKDPEIHLFWQNHFQAILVDEFQDTNKVQLLLLKLLMKPDAQNITFVGDDDQSIYSFRGANIGNILNLSQEIPYLHIIRLEENYRSNPQILHIANSVIQHNTNRLGKTLFTNRLQNDLPILYIAPTDEQEANYCINKFVEEYSQKNQTLAIIYRTNIQSRIFERELVNRGISYTLLGGRKFYEKKEIRDIVAYLRILVNPEDNLAVLRVINTPSRGIGDVSKDKIFAYAKKHKISLEKILKNIPADIKISKNAQDKILDWLMILIDLRETSKQNPEELIKILIEAIEYKDYLEEYDKDIQKTEDRVSSLEELERAYLHYISEGKTLADFVENIALMDSSDTRSNKENLSQQDNLPSIILSTVHGCKGLEFDHVCVVGLVEEIFPHYLSIETQEQLEEERRLFYVAITRAKQSLLLSSPAKLFARGQWELFYQSRFIQEIPEELLQLENAGLRKIEEKWYKDLL